MTNEADPAPLSRILKVDEIKDGASGEIVATAAEMHAIAGLLDLARLEGLTFNYRLDRGIAGRLHLSGRLKADLTQTCVVSLEPVDARVDVPVEIEFWPETLLATPDSEDPASRHRAGMARADRRWADRPGRGGLRDPGHLARSLSQAGRGKLRLVASGGARRPSRPRAAHLRPLPRSNGARARPSGKIRLSLTAFFSLFGFHFRGLPRLGRGMGQSLSRTAQTMGSPVTIALDAMGGDHGPSVVVPAAAIALVRHPEMRFLLVGDRADHRAGARRPSRARRQVRA